MILTWPRAYLCCLQTYRDRSVSKQKNVCSDQAWSSSNSVVTSPSATSTAVASSGPMTSYAQATSQAPTVSKAHTYYTSPQGPVPTSPGEVSPLPSMGPGAVRTSPSGGLMERTWNTNNRSPQSSTNLILDHQPLMPNRNSRNSDKATSRPTIRNSGLAS